VEESGQLRLEVRDDGRGFEPEAPPRPEGTGLRSLRTRARRLGGAFEIASAPGATRVGLRMPVGAT
ncbi:MAG: histidine kinase, partial [Paucibacter sp.]|nr:histidine kinase [Roseateles sp.]